MRIQHNIAALNSHRQLGNNNNVVSKNLEKLSSGYRINRAGDDAAGLAISEKMRAQITGLETAQKNANDGISLIQTAEGALTEVHSMLNRMVELTERSANGTYQNAVDRENLQKEMNSLRDEIDRISEGTNFNGINLLDSSLNGGSTVGGLTGASIVNFKGAATNAANGTNLQTVKVETAGADNALKTFTFTSGQKDGDSKISFTGGTNTVLGQTVGTGAISSNAPVMTLGPAPADLNGDFIMKLGDQTISVNLQGVTNANDVATQLQAAIDTALTNYDTAQGLSGDDRMSGKISVSLNKDGALEFVNNTGKELAFEDKGDQEFAKNLGISTESKTLGNGGLTLQIGDTADSFNQLTVSINSMSTKALGLSGINIGTQAGAAAALDKIKAAINTVSSTRGDLGAIQNRLEHTINNLSVTAENMTAAESRIRDVDMAEEMMNFTKNNILTQASQAMLAQANQLPQGVLQLLQ